MSEPLIQVMIKELIGKRQIELETPIEVKPNLNFWESIIQFFAEGLKSVKVLLPSKYKFSDDILETLIKVAETPAQQKIAFAARRTEELRQEQAESLKK